MMRSCADPSTPAPTVKPPSTPERIVYNDSNYVYNVGEDPYQNWDYQGDDSRNARYCHGMVGAAKGSKSGNKYNQHLKSGYYTCDSSLVSGLPGSGTPKCWCNPNYEWNEFTKKKPSRSWGALGDLAYEGWTK